MGESGFDCFAEEIGGVGFSFLAQNAIGAEAVQPGFQNGFDAAAGEDLNDALASEAALPLTAAPPAHAGDATEEFAEGEFFGGGRGAGGGAVMRFAAVA